MHNFAGNKLVFLENNYSHEKCLKIKPSQKNTIHFFSFMVIKIIKVDKSQKLKHDKLLQKHNKIFYCIISYRYFRKGKKIILMLFALCWRIAMFKFGKINFEKIGDFFSNYFINSLFFPKRIQKNMRDNFLTCAL